MGRRQRSKISDVKRLFCISDGKKQIDRNEENMSDLNIVVTHPFRRMINVNEIHLVDHVHAIREDHDEGIYI